jgi:hypothetical protein
MLVFFHCGCFLVFHLLLPLSGILVRTMKLDLHGTWKGCQKESSCLPFMKFCFKSSLYDDSAKTWTRKPCGIMKCMCKESPQVAGALDICVTYPRSCSWRCLTIKLNFVHLSFHQVSFTTSYISTIQLWTKNCHSCSEFCEFITPGIACGKWL